MSLNINIEILKEGAKVPTKAHASDAAFDLYFLSEFKTECVGFGRSKLMSTGIAIDIPSGYCGIIKSRSGLSVKNGIDVGAGVIDSGYKGEIKILLRNQGKKSVWLENGERIAQIMFLPVPVVNFNIVQSLDDSERGIGGFGSTGK
jgi:dUTP pyrophosphatase